MAFFFNNTREIVDFLKKNYKKSEQSNAHNTNKDRETGLDLSENSQRHASRNHA